MSDPLLANPTSLSGVYGEEAWTVAAFRGVGSLYVTTNRTRQVAPPGASWSPEQATGAPNATLGADDRNAWASQSQDGGMEWLEATFAAAVVPKAVRVHETYCPGALVRVSVFDAKGAELTAWEGNDPTPRHAKAGISTVPLQINFPIRRLKLYLDSAAVAGWNEIDAIGLVDHLDQVHWAQHVTASTWYGQPTAAPAVPFPKNLVPAWSGLDQASSEFTRGESLEEDRAVDLRGWPFLAMWGRRDGLPTNTRQLPRNSSFMPRGLSVPGPGGAMPPGVRLRPYLPYRPLAIGFACNAVLYSGAVALMWWLATVPMQFVREVSRVRQGRCVRCGYDLQFEFALGCPECGWRRGSGNGEAGRP